MRLREGVGQWACFGDSLALPVRPKQLLGTLGEHAAHLPTLALHASNLHRVVGCRLVPHPGDDGGFHATLKWDSLGAGYGAAADGRGMIGHGRRECVGEAGVPFMKTQKRQDSPTEILDIFLLGFLPPLRPCRLFLGMGFRGSLSGMLIANPADGLAWCPNASRENPAADFLLNDPVLAGSLHAASEASITGRQKIPATRDGMRLAQTGSHGVGLSSVRTTSVRGMRAIKFCATIQTSGGIHSELRIHEPPNCSFLRSHRR